jgi:hypothetical protein
VDAARVDLDERFPGDDLDLEVWSPYYLPHWSSRAESAASYAVRDGELHLTIPADQPLWCADVHEEPVRISCIQSANGSGPVGSANGPLPFRTGLLVREEQPPMWGYTPLYGHIEVRMRGLVTSRSMVAFWMSGLEDRPERSGEICVAEIFGASVRNGSAEVGTGIHQFRDPALREEWAAERFDIDVAAFHTYGVDWRPGSVALSIDGRVVRRLDQAPDYPMQLFIGVFDFPARAIDGEAPAVPELIVSHVQGRAAGTA